MPLPPANEPPPPQRRFRPESFVVAAFARCAIDNYARVLENHRLLAFYALGTRRGASGIPPEHTRLQPVFGLLNYAAGKTLPAFTAESLRFRLFPAYDRWVKSLLRPGQHLLTSVAFANECQKWVRRNGGLVFVDSGNSHPRFFWRLLSDEHKRWKSPYPPVARHFSLRGAESADCGDYIFAESTFVRDSFIAEGMDPGRIFICTVPQDIRWFKPSATERPKTRPLTLLNTGALCLRKGTPYLLEAFRLILKKEPRAVLRLNRNVRDDAREILRRYADLPIDWSPGFNLRFEDQRQRYVERFQTSDICVFPSIEDGFAIVVGEALACGLPVITTRNTGASDLIQPGENGEIVPIRDPEATAEAVLKWWTKLQEGKRVANLAQMRERLSFETFERTMLGHLASLGVS
jgi:glycosyltransferase involved in cell wall biosynthesis